MNNSLCSRDEFQMFRCCLMLKYPYIRVRTTRVDTCLVVIHTNRCKRANEIKEYDTCIFHVCWLPTTYIFRLVIKRKINEQKKRASHLYERISIKIALSVSLLTLKDMYTISYKTKNDALERC